MNNRWRQKRKMTGYHFSKLQVWNATDTMSTFILALLKEFKKAKRHGYPGRDEADTPEKWEAILDRLIYTFDQLSQDFPDSPYNKAYDRLQQEHPERWGYTCQIDENGNRVLKEKNPKLYDQYITAEVKQQEKEYRNSIQNGLTLFAKYYQDLWD